MSYVKTTWQDDATPLSAVNMNNIEQGVFDSTKLKNVQLEAGTIQLYASNANMVIANTTVYTSEGSPVPKIGLGGTLRISVNVKTTSPATGYVQILRNGLPVGIERTTTSTTAVTFTEDIAGWNVGDVLSFQCKSSGAYNTYGGLLKILVGGIPQVY